MRPKLFSQSSALKERVLPNLTASCYPTYQTIPKRRFRDVSYQENAACSDASWRDRRRRNRVAGNAIVADYRLSKHNPGLDQVSDYGLQRARARTTDCCQ